MKGLIKEFKEFAVKGNMFDLAIGMIIGAAFTSIVNSLVNDIIMPLIGRLTGGIDFNNLFIALDGNTYPSLEAAGDAALLKYGAFLSNVLNFIIVALVLFAVVKQLNKIKAATKKKEAEPAPTEKECPYCKSKINIKATRCPHCTSEL